MRWSDWSFGGADGRLVERMAVCWSRWPLAGVVGHFGGAVDHLVIWWSRRSLGGAVGRLVERMAVCWSGWPLGGAVDRLVEGMAAWWSG